MVFDADSSELVDVGNRSAEQLFGASRRELLSMSMVSFCTYNRTDAADRHAARSWGEASVARTDGTRWLLRSAHGEHIPCRLLRLGAHRGLEALHLVRCAIMDVASRKRDEQIAAGGRAVLEKVVAALALLESRHVDRPDTSRPSREAPLRRSACWAPAGGARV